jgi:hypothetical protein
MRWGDHAITAQAGAGHGRHYFLSSQPLDRDPAFTKRMFRHDCAKREKCFVGGPIVSRATGRRNIWAAKIATLPRGANQHTAIAVIGAISQVSSARKVIVHGVSEWCRRSSEVRLPTIRSPRSQGRSVHHRSFVSVRVFIEIFCKTLMIAGHLNQLFLDDRVERPPGLFFQDLRNLPMLMGREDHGPLYDINGFDTASKSPLVPIVADRVV